MVGGLACATAVFRTRIVLPELIPRLRPAQHRIRRIMLNKPLRRRVPVQPPPPRHGDRVERAVHRARLADSLTNVMLNPLTGEAGMATFVLVHGAWHGSWCWARVRR